MFDGAQTKSAAPVLARIAPAWRGSELRAITDWRYATSMSARGFLAAIINRVRADQYDQPENRLSHALAVCLNEDRRLLTKFLGWIGVEPPRHGRRLHVVEQTLPGDAPESEEQAERRGLPESSSMTMRRPRLDGKGRHPIQVSGRNMGAEITKVFIAGSRQLSRLNADVKHGTARARAR